MTQIITIAKEKSLFLASDSRLNYFEDINLLSQKYQEIRAIADCIQKTFYIKNARIGIQFLGIGYFPDGNEKYPLSYFVTKANQLNFKHKSFSMRCKLIYDFLNNLSELGNTGQYVKGVMAGFQNHNKHICTFNTFNNKFEIKEVKNNEYINSEKTQLLFQDSDISVIQSIERNISTQSTIKPWIIGGSIDILKITEYSGRFVRKNNFTFDKSQSELLKSFNNDISKINGRILTPPKRVKYE